MSWFLVSSNFASQKTKGYEPEHFRLQMSFCSTSALELPTITSVQGYSKWKSTLEGAKNNEAKLEKMRYHPSMYIFANISKSNIPSP